jgi:hypothetical protein
MNDSNPAPSNSNPMPPIIPPADSNPPLKPNMEELAPIHGIVATAEAILRQPRRVMFQLRQAQQSRLIAALLIIALGCSLVYGVVVGTFSGGQQLWAAPLKISGGLLISALICLPSLYIFSCLGGSQARLVEVFGLVGGLLTLMTVLLIGFAPVAWVFSQSTQSVYAMGCLHLGFWAVATFFGVRFLFAGFKGMSAKPDSGLKVWVVIFVLVALQMTTALRPIIGTADSFLPSAQEKKFFTSHWMDCLKGEGEQAKHPARYQSTQ